MDDLSILIIPPSVRRLAVSLLVFVAIVSTAAGVNVTETHVQNKVDLALLSTLKIGESMGGGSSEDLQPDNYRVAVGGVVENYTKWPLLLIGREVKSGKVTLPIGNVFSGFMEGFSSRKTSYTATGSWVRYSFQLDDDILAHVMYCAPFNFDFFKNKMAVAVCGADDVEKACRQMDAKTMYYDNDSPYVDRGNFEEEGERVVKCWDNVCMVGEMQGDHRPTVRVRVYPKYYHDLPYDVRSKGVVSEDSYKEFASSIVHA